MKSGILIFCYVTLVLLGVWLVEFHEDHYSQKKKPINFASMGRTRCCCTGSSGVQLELIIKIRLTSLTQNARICDVPMLRISTKPVRSFWPPLVWKISTADCCGCGAPLDEVQRSVLGKRSFPSEARIYPPRNFNILNILSYHLYGLYEFPGTPRPFRELALDQLCISRFNVFL